jgi:hypothetical protein
MNRMQDRVTLCTWLTNLSKCDRVQIFGNATSKSKLFSKGNEEQINFVEY